MVVAVGGAVLSARAYYKDTQERIATLHKNNAKMEVVQQQNEAVMKNLRKVDEVAFIRFSSVYRRFEDITEFSEEVEKLVKD